MVWGITRGFIVLLITAALLADASYLFCLESPMHDNHLLIENILNREDKNSENPTNSHDHQNHHDPFHHFNHTSQIAVNISVDSWLGNYGNFPSQVQDFPIKISTVYPLEKDTKPLLYLQQKFRFRPPKEHINFLSILLI